MMSWTTFTVDVSEPKIAPPTRKLAAVANVLALYLNRPMPGCFIMERSEAPARAPPAACQPAANNALYSSASAGYHSNSIVDLKQETFSPFFVVVKHKILELGWIDGWGKRGRCSKWLNKERFC